MSALIEKYGLKELTADEKSLLAEDLLESVAQEDEAAPVPPEFLGLLKTRMERIEADRALGIDRGVPWEVVRDRVRARRRS